MPDMRPPHLHPLRWLGQRDRGFAALRRATRAAIIMPAMFAVGDKVIGNPQVATFAAFGSFAMLLLVDFGGPMAQRLQAQAALDAAERHCLLAGLVDGVVELVEPHPSPVDAVVGDQPVLEIHGLDYVRLVALRGVARILLDQQSPVGEVSPAAEPAVARSGLDHLRRRQSYPLPASPLLRGQPAPIGVPHPSGHTAPDARSPDSVALAQNNVKVTCRS
jgi:hypothetical protein